MTVLYLVLLSLSSLCFIAAAFGKVFRGLNLVALGLAIWVTVPILVTFQSL